MVRYVAYGSYILKRIYIVTGTGITGNLKKYNGTGEWIAMWKSEMFFNNLLAANIVLLISVNILVFEVV